MIALGVAVFLLGVLLGYQLGARPCRHRWTLHLSRSRIWLACPLCGTESPGWELYEKRSALDA
jgi:hypothetical protein